MTNATVQSSLMSTCSEGPAVSLKGSPTVSPTTAALCASEPLAAQLAGLDEFLGVVPSAAAVVHEHGHQDTGNRADHQDRGDGFRADGRIGRRGEKVEDVADADRHADGEQAGQRPSP